MQQPSEDFPACKGIPDQLSELHSISRALGAEHSRSRLSESEILIPTGYAGMVAVPALGHFGSLRIPTALEAWAKKTGWHIRSRIPGVKRNEHLSFPANAFEAVQATRDAFSRLDHHAVLAGGSSAFGMRLFPVRVSLEAEPTLEDGEFFLDLASLAWVLATHHEWRRLPGEFLLRCLGETYADHGTLFIGYDDDMRKLTERSDERALRGPVLIGFAL